MKYWNLFLRIIDDTNFFILHFNWINAISECDAQEHRNLMKRFSTEARHCKE